jgi:type I restriction enzyme S subunit
MNEVDLPDEWFLTKFTEVLDIQGGTQPPKAQFIDELQEGYVRLLQIRDFGAKPVPTFIPDTSKLKQCGINDLLIGRYGASLGRICSGMEGAYNVALAKVISGEYLHKPFLKAYLESEMFQQPLALLSRSAQNGFNKDDLATFDFALLPLAEQKVIAEKLDTLLAQVDTTKARLERIPDIIKRFRQSVLAAAVSGKLTEEWRGDNGLEEPSQQKLGCITGEISQGWSPKCLNEEVTDESWGVIKTSSVQEVVFNQYENKKLPDTLTEKESLKIYPGDILTTRAGPRSRCGVTCYVEDISLNLMICDKVYRYRVKENVGLSKFLVLLLNSPATLEEVESLKTGISESGMNLTQKKFKELNLFWPSVREQLQIVRRVEELFTFADTIEQKAAAALERVNNLTQSILAKAFRGELTADWRAANPELISGDNSAEALLARIQAEREALALEKKAAKKPRTKQPREKKA